MKNFALFNYGFRPFFLAAGFHALIAIPLWLLLFHGNVRSVAGFDDFHWHMHEMLFGFLAAAIAGFILTAVPNWAGKRSWSGWSLGALSSLWLAGRALSFPFFSLPLAFAAGVDLLFVPVLLGFVLFALAGTKNKHNYFIALMLGLYWLADVLCWLEPVAGVPTWEHGITLGFDAVLLLVVVIGGRVIPSFTTNYLKRIGQAPDIAMNTDLDKLAMIVTLCLVALHQAGLDAVWLGWASVVAALLHAARLMQWHGWKAWREPLVWILHIGYMWIPIAFALQATQLLTHASFATAWRHAFSVGTFSCMILGIMSRAALGHTGRDLRVSRWMVAGYLALIGAGIVRVFVAPLAAATHYYVALSVSGLLWYMAFLIYVIIYTPILVSPRPDGREG